MTLENLPDYLLLIAVCLPMFAAALSRLESRWRIAQAATGLAALLSLASWGWLLQHVTSVSTAWLNHSRLNVTMLVLISFIAFIVVCYAKTNFESDRDNRRFLQWFMLTVLAVMVTVSSNHLIVFWLAWTAISLSMHQLLTFYGDRYRANLAAHKKFIFARLAEMCLLAAFLLLHNVHRTWSISEIIAQYPSAVLSWQQQTAGVLLAMAALIKCAQLPLHGWLIQVVESPTPVSALMHAGVINMGGFLLLSFAPLMSQVPIAQWLLLTVAGLTTVIAALIMMTRISIKVRLAWSTTAQMGLMLVECALGLYELAFLHLIAHSCYKAHAFLNSGNAVEESMQKQYVAPTKPLVSTWLISAAITFGLLTTIQSSGNGHVHLPLSPWILIGFALTFMLTRRLHKASPAAALRGVLESAALLASYYLLKTGVTFLLPTIEHPYSIVADAWISILFIGLLAAYLLMQYQPNRPQIRKLFVSLNAGFYLDEWATRTTLQIWPIKHAKNVIQNRLIISENK